MNLETDKSPQKSRNTDFLNQVMGPTEINDDNRAAFLDFLDDRSKFHVWLTSIVTGSIVALISFGVKPDLQTLSGKMSILGIGVMLFSVLANLVCIWSIPTIKFSVRLGHNRFASFARWDLAASAWIGVIGYFLGLLLAGFAMVSS